MNDLIISSNNIINNTNTKIFYNNINLFNDYHIILILNININTNILLLENCNITKIIAYNDFNANNFDKHIITSECIQENLELFILDKINKLIN
jgi:hypothetical protein